MAEFQELIKDAPEFASMERGELVAYAYAMYASGAKMDAENAKLRELVRVMAYCMQHERECDGCSMNGSAGIITERAGCDELLARLRELGIEVEE